jgi:SPP1 family predicted phage head-tail adaptor
MEAGKLRHKVKLQRRVVSQDTFGGGIEVYHDIAEVWARVQPLRGEEYFKAQAITSSVSARITIRYLFGIEPIDRVLFGDREFNVHAIINPEERNVELQLMCEEVK